jgi:hypothetical protein
VRGILRPSAVIELFSKGERVYEDQLRDYILDIMENEFECGHVLLPFWSHLFRVGADSTKNIFEQAFELTLVNWMGSFPIKLLT